MADTPKTTVMGNTFIAPKDWTVTVKGPATILEAPEGGFVGCAGGRCGQGR